MWPWELYEMLNLAAAIERAGSFDIIHYEAAYYPMSLAFTRLSPTPIVQTLHHSPSEAELKLWAHYPEARYIAISKEQARLLSGFNVVGTVLHGIDTDRFTFRERPDDYLLFLGRFTEGKGPVQAIDVARRLGMRLILAAAEEPYYRRARETARRREADRLFRRGRLRREGPAVRRRPRAALSDSGARAVRPRPGGSDGLRHAGRGPRSRRGSRGRRRRHHRGRLRRPGADGRRTAARLRARSDARPPARRWRGSASSAWSGEYAAVYQRVVEAHRAGSSR